MIDSVVVKNLVTMAEININQKSGNVYFLDEIDWGSVASNHQSYKFINQIGVHVTASTLETRDIIITGWIVGRDNEELIQKRHQLNTMINPQHMHEIRYKEYRLEFLPISSIKYSVAFEENNEVMCKFLISGFCPDPLFQKIIENRVEAATTKGYFLFPLFIPGVNQGKEEWPPGVDGGIIMGLRQHSLLVDFTNDGDVETGIIITFRALATVENPMITNALTLEFFRINKIMQAGETIVINTQDGNKSVNGGISGNVVNYYRYRDLNSTWIKLAVGDNLFRYDAVSGVESLEVILNFPSRFLEVQ